MDNEQKVIYLFCLARSSFLPAIEGTGLDRQNPLFLWDFLDITAVLSMVSLEEFSGPLAESRLQDLAWVGPRAYRHEEVIEWVMAHSSVLPARFGTLFSSLESLERLLRKHYDTISPFLDWIADKEEWGVRGLMDRTAAKKELLSLLLARQEGQVQISRPDIPTSPGMRYFQEQRRQLVVEKELNHWLKGICQEIANNLTQYALDFQERRVVPRGGRSDADRILNWAFLVPRSARADFRAQIDQANADYAQQGLTFELSGPWPPYSFSPSLSMGPEG